MNTERVDTRPSTHVESKNSDGSDEVYYAGGKDTNIEVQWGQESVHEGASPGVNTILIKDSSQIHIGTLNQQCFPGGQEEDSEQYRIFCETKLQGRFVKTRPYREVRDALEARNSVLMTGGSGDGKSAILQYFAANPFTEYLPIRIDRPKEIKEHVRLARITGRKLLFLIDDVIGSSYILHGRIDEWVCLGKNLEMYLSLHKFLLATRKILWEHGKIHLQKSPFFSNRVEVTSDKLTPSDKRSLLDNYLGSSLKLDDTHKDEIVQNVKALAYTQCCKLLRDAIEKEMSGEELVQIFKKPYRFLESELENMADKERKSYAALCLIMLCGGELACSELTGTLEDVTPGVREIISAVWQTCGCSDVLHVAVENLQTCAEKLKGAFLEKQFRKNDLTITEVYTFSHESIQEAVTMRYGKLHFRLCLRFLPSDLIVKIARPYNYEREELEFVVCVSVDAQNTNELVKVFTDVAIDGNWALHDVFQNPCVRGKEFQESWIEHLNSAPHKLRDLLQSKSWNGTCISHMSSQSGSLELRRFLASHQNVCTCGPDTVYPLTMAASNRDMEAVKNLIGQWKQADAELGQAVNVACKNGHVEMLDLLLQETNSDRRDDIICGGFREACREGRFGTVEYMIEKYYTPCRKSKCGCGEGLMAASSEGHGDILDILMSHGTDINIRDNVDRTGLHHAASCGHTKTVQDMVDHGADINIRQNVGGTCLHHAAKGGHTQTVRVILQRGAHLLNVTDNDGWTCLHLAASAGHTETVRELLHHGADINITNTDHKTCLHYAAVHGHTLVVSDLLCFGADKNIKTKNDNTATDLAKREGHREVIDLLTKHRANENSLRRDKAQTVSNEKCPCIII